MTHCAAAAAPTGSRPRRARLPYGQAGGDESRGDEDDDKLRGGKGDDRVIGGTGKDLLTAGGGRDVVSSADGERDRVRCGRNRDRATVDRLDKVRGCEKVRVRGRARQSQP